MGVKVFPRTTLLSKQIKCLNKLVSEEGFMVDM